MKNERFTAAEAKEIANTAEGALAKTLAHQLAYEMGEKESLLEALEYCASPYQQKHMIKRELVGESAKRMMIAKMAVHLV